MKYIVTSKKNIDELFSALEQTIIDNNFGLQHVHNIKEKLNAKGVELKHECRVLDICNPFIAKEILDIDMSASAFLPCAISIFENNGITTISVIKPTSIFPILNENLVDVAQRVEEALVKIINQAI